MKPEKKPENKMSPQMQAKPYLKYSGLAFQMIAILIAAAYGGMWLDEKQGNKNPWWTITLMLVSVIASIYMIISSVTKNN